MFDDFIHTFMVDVLFYAYDSVENRQDALILAPMRKYAAHPFTLTLYLFANCTIADTPQFSRGYAVCNT